MLNKLKVLLIGLCIGSVAFVSIASVSDGDGGNYFEISKNLEIFSELMRELNVYYVDEIKPGALTKIAIDAMLSSLDPYTNYIPEEAIEDYRLSTTGQYGGIGAVVRKYNEYIVVVEPYKGFPAQKAGLRAGDVIVKVEDKSTKGKTTSQVVDLMRGAPGMPVEITVKRDGIVKVFNVVRENVQIKNVPYFGMVSNDIAYVKLTRFTRDAASNIKKALQKLTENNTVKGVILDLRGNPGGLLREAISVCNLFVEKGKLIVSTRGKIEEWNNVYKTREQPFNTTMLVAILVSSSSASASEIVSGAMQDLDRGIVLGQRTFGKGLVQTTRVLPYNSRLKVTTSKYYIPSGRCIQELDYAHEGTKIADSLRSQFKTVNGRIVYDGGGIYPDVYIKPDKTQPVLVSLIRNHLIFDYATKFSRKNDSIPPAKSFNLTEQQYQTFIQFAENEGYEYETPTEKALEDYKKIAKEHKSFQHVKEAYEALLLAQKSSKQKDIIHHSQQVKSFLEQEIASRYYYQSGRVEAMFSEDIALDSAIAILHNTKRYNYILSSDFKIKLIDSKIDDKPNLGNKSNSDILEEEQMDNIDEDTN